MVMLGAPAGRRAYSRIKKRDGRNIRGGESQLILGVRLWVITVLK